VCRAINLGIEVSSLEASSAIRWRGTSFGILLAALSLTILAAPAPAAPGGGGYVMVMPGPEIQKRQRRSTDGEGALRQIADVQERSHSYTCGGGI
jgi:hypothetical protein